MSEEKNLSFEESLKRLEQIVKKLEGGEAPLDEALSLFEEGTGLVKSCDEMLNKAEQKVLQLKKNECGEPVEIDFEAE
jgi:exodeoxyribonuclease VII small subunit